MMITCHGYKRDISRCTKGDSLRLDHDNSQGWLSNTADYGENLCSTWGWIFSLNSGINVHKPPLFSGSHYKARVLTHTCIPTFVKHAISPELASAMFKLFSTKESAHQNAGSHLKVTTGYSLCTWSEARVLSLVMGNNMLIPSWVYVVRLCTRTIYTQFNHKFCRHGTLISGPILVLLLISINFNYCIQQRCLLIHRYLQVPSYF